MARKQRKDETKLVNETGETIQLVYLSPNGNRSREPIPLASQGEYMIKSTKPTDTGSMLEVYDGNNNFTNIVINSFDLLKVRKLKITKKARPPTTGAPRAPVAMYFEVVKKLWEEPAKGKDKEVAKRRPKGKDKEVGKGLPKRKEKEVVKGPAKGKEKEVVKGPAKGKEKEVVKGPAKGKEKEVVKGPAKKK